MYFVYAIFRLHYEQQPDAYKWAEKIYNGDIIACLPSLHEYSHNLRCQMQYGSSNNYQMGKTDGEGTERIWSYARKFSSSLLKLRYFTLYICTSNTSCTNNAKYFQFFHLMQLYIHKGMENIWIRSPKCLIFGIPISKSLI